jgi:hypothetical protein
MATYTVTETRIVFVTLEVEADSEEQAIRRYYDDHESVKLISESIEDSQGLCASCPE